MHLIFLAYLVVLLLVLYLLRRVRSANKLQEKLVKELKGQHFWRVNLARESFLKKIARFMPFEAKGVLVDEGDQLRLKGFWIENQKFFDIRIPRSDCEVQWLGNRTLNAGNLYWASLTTPNWKMLFCADTGLYALSSRQGLSDLLRTVFPDFVQNEAQTRDFSLEKNPRSLCTVVLFLGALLFALFDTIVFNKHELIQLDLLEAMTPPFAAGIAMLAMALIGFAGYKFLIHGGVPSREAYALGLFTTLALAGAFVPSIKRLDQLLADGPAQSYVYRVADPEAGTLEPADDSLGLPQLKLRSTREYWRQFPKDEQYNIPLLHGPLGLWQLDHKTFGKPIKKFYEEHPEY